MIHPLTLSGSALSALYHGFDDLALKLAEKRMPRNRGEATEATQPRDTPATELARSGDFKSGPGLAPPH